jgi:hypothetical protein
VTLTPYLPAATGSQASIPATDPAAAETAAQQIASASYTGYGLLPNPELVYEAAQTGAGATISNLTMLGTPQYAALLTGTPAGQPLSSQPYANLKGVTSPSQSQSVTQYTAQTAASQKALLGQSGNSSWQSFGEVPIPNTGYTSLITQGINPQTGKADPAYVKKWQSLLSQQGFYLPTDTGNKVTGVWNPQTDTAALYGFMAAKFMPDAMFSTDPTTQQQASLFLTGLGYDVTSMQSQMRDPTMLSQVAQQWMAAQGPGTTQSTNLLQDYANTYGMSALPTSYQAIIRPDPLAFIRDGLLNLPGVSILNNVPLLSGGLHAAVNLLTGNLDMAHLVDDPRNTQVQQIKQQMSKLDGMSATDIQNLTPILTQVADDSGFMGFMDSWNQAKGQFILSIASTLFTGISKGEWQNPFDPTSSANLWAQSHADDMAGAIFGDQWAQNNPAFAGILNFVINTVDDPTSYIPLLGQLAAVQKLEAVGQTTKLLGEAGEAAPVVGKITQSQSVLGLRSAFGLLHDPETRQIWGDIAGNNMRDQTANGMLSATRLAYQSKRIGLQDAARGFDIPLVGSQAVGKLDLVQKIMEAPDLQTARQLYEDGDGTVMGFGHLAASSRSMYNKLAHWKAAVPKAAKSGKLRLLSGLGGMPEHPNFNVITDPVKAADIFHDYALIAGMQPAEYDSMIREFTDAATGKSGTTADAVRTAQETWEKVLTAYAKNHRTELGISTDATDKEALSQATAVLDKVHQGRVQSGTLTPVRTIESETNLFAPKPSARAPEQATEVSTSIRNEASVRILEARRMTQLEDEIAVAKTAGLPTDHVQSLQSELDALKAKPRQGGVPMLTTQQADLWSPDYSPFEMTVGLSPVLRKAEWVQSKLRADALNSIWKRWTIARLSSAFRMDLGDDVIRPVAMAIGSGHPIVGLRLLGHSIGRAVGLVVPGARSLTQAETARILNSPDLQRMTSNAAQIANEWLPQAFGHYLPNDVGYSAALEHVLTNLFTPDPMVQTWLKAYDEAAPSAAHDAVLAQMQNPGDNARLNDWITGQQAHLSPEHLSAAVGRWDAYMREFFRSPDLRRWVQNGNVPQSALTALVKKQANLTDSMLPTVVARLNNPYSRSGIMGTIGKYPNAVMEKITEPMIDNARANGFMAVKGLYEKSIYKHYAGKALASRPDFAQMVEQESTSQALNWMLNNTYQFSRSALGGALRNVFPFYGATANLDRFVMRQALSTPLLGTGVVQAANASNEAQVNTTAPALTGANGFMAMLGFGGGTGIQFNPMNAFFLTADGLGSVVPGTGPVFAPIWQGIASVAPPQVLQMLSSIPGISQEINWSTGQANPQWPWIADLLTAGALGITGDPNNPLVGAVEHLGLGPIQAGMSQDRVNQLIDEKIQQMDRNKQGSGPGGIVTNADQQAAARSVAADLAAQGALQWALPVSPEVKDTVAQNIQTQMDTWRAAPTDQEKSLLTQQALGITAEQWNAILTQSPNAPSWASIVKKDPTSAGLLMAYEDSRLSSDQQDELAAAAPWLVDATTSKYQYTTATSPTNLSQWDLLRNVGDINTLQPFGNQNAYVANVEAQREINAGWLEYDQLKNWEYALMSQNNWSTQSPQYQAWNDAYFQPAVVNLGTQYPAWQQAFGAAGGGSNPAALVGSSAKLRSLQTWMVIPQHGDYETAQSVLWRNAIQAQQQASSMLYELNLTGGSAVEKQMVMDQLANTLQQLSSTNPDFAAQLAKFRFGQWEDVVNLEADEQLANYYSAQAMAYSGGVPT